MSYELFLHLYVRESTRTSILGCLFSFTQLTLIWLLWTKDSLLIQHTVSDRTKCHEDKMSQAKSCKKC